MYVNSLKKIVKRSDFYLKIVYNDREGIGGIMGKILDEKCLNCGASIKYNSKLNKFICEYCKGEFTIEDMNKHKKKLQKENKLDKEFDQLEDVEGYHCTNCGAEIISLENISSTTCIYCKSSAIIKNRLTGVYKPDSIIPFKYEKKDAITAFLYICKGRLLIPRGFRDEKNIESMEGLYVPFWLYDCQNDCLLKANGTKVSTWMDSRYIYTKTDYYNVVRGGDLNFVSVPNDAATRFDDTIMNAIEPFEYKDLKEFNPSYLAGFLSEKYDVSRDEAYKNAKKRIENDSKSFLRQEMNGYSTIIEKENTNQITIKEIKYVFLPVWVLNIKYKDKIYHFAMNGQTKKLVGEIPVDGKKLFLLILIVMIVSFAILLAYFLSRGYRW